MLVRPANKLNVDAPDAPEINSCDVLTSCENSCPPLSTKKLELAVNRPFCVKAIAMTLVAADVFWTKIDFDTFGKL